MPLIVDFAHPGFDLASPSIDAAGGSAVKAKLTEFQLNRRITCGRFWVFGSR